MTEQTNSPAHIKHAMIIEELDAEGKLWMTGVPIPDDDAAKDFAAFLSKVKEAEKAAEADKESEYRPIKTALGVVTLNYSDTLKTAVRIMKVGNKLITDYETAKRQAAAARAAEIAAEAARKAEEARKAIQASAGDLEGREAAEGLLEAAKTHEIAAKVAAKAPDRVKVGGRAVPMREYVDVEVTDDFALLKWAYMRDPAPLIEVAVGMAKADAKAGLHKISGVKITRERRAA